MFTAACASVPPLRIVFLDFPSARLIAAERRQKVVRSAKRSLTSTICCAPLTLAKGVRIKVTQLLLSVLSEAGNQ